MGSRLGVQKRARKSGGKGRGRSYGKGSVVTYVQDLQGPLPERDWRKLRTPAGGLKLFPPNRLVRLSVAIDIFSCNICRITRKCKNF